MTAVMRNPCHFMDTCIEERETVKTQVSLLDLTIDAGIQDDVIWLLMGGKHIVSVPHHDGLLVVRVDDDLDEDIDGMADFAMRLKEGTLAALDMTTRTVKRPSDSVPKVNDRPTCFESVVVSLSVRVGVSGVLCHLDSSNYTTRHDAGWWFWSALSSGFIDGSFGRNAGHICPVLICFLDVK